MPVVIEGVVELKKALRKLAPDIKQEMDKNVREALKPIIRDARSHVGGVAPGGLINWNDPGYERKSRTGRKNAFPAAGRISPDYYCMDGTIPRKHLAKVLLGIAEMEKTYGLRCANVFHAGDGNLHPLILFDANQPGEFDRAEKFGAAILELCVEVGGTITGEHGVGIEKINSMCVQYSEQERDTFFAVKRAFDVAFLLNPDKAIPTLVRCAEYGKMHVKRGELKFSDLPRF